MVRLDRALVQSVCATAPARFVLHARNPDRHLHVGGRVVNFGPVNGTPHVTDLQGGRRYGTLEDFRSILKVTHALGVLHWQGGVVTEPTDIPVATRHLDMYRAHVECSDIVWAARGVGGVQVPARPVLRPAFEKFREGASRRFLERVAQQLGFGGPV
jgi:trimethylamine--corrinoid protein Co-methyltransferase